MSFTLMNTHFQSIWNNLILIYHAGVAALFYYIDFFFWYGNVRQNAHSFRYIYSLKIEHSLDLRNAVFIFSAHRIFLLDKDQFKVMLLDLTIQVASRKKMTSLSIFGEICFSQFIKKKNSSNFGFLFFHLLLSKFLLNNIQQVLPSFFGLIFNCCESLKKFVTTRYCIPSLNIYFHINCAKRVIFCWEISQFNAKNNTFYAKFI